jgi:hypothetical protein
MARLLKWADAQNMVLWTPVTSFSEFLQQLRVAEIAAYFSSPYIVLPVPLPPAPFCNAHCRQARVCSVRGAPSARVYKGPCVRCPGELFVAVWRMVSCERLVGLNILIFVGASWGPR